ncbi:putative lipoyltransferase 2, mitochondrial [Neocloeon triangulifer]|uniref:putative lipoyltransferase 2, mitochondrial n=1 Tax=Neocloeon triangulifer TaxID=2078957 RepID=UPI00286F64A0|nr:putative lipoyltransferase 2, mitochondrial [Neocloeon triangulifer]XP_059486072.1 putative lipoyltransferase 2, mitochondrial [Neocloeon triangulifer]XP_059486081.1 putative lipoyltransferase 2, mitochondrial [Neocloeon triangulifer]XP_059486091.1 putative lipoyltransferase 2, mitochondrial [Neocloeon triangulifer]
MANLLRYWATGNVRYDKAYKIQKALAAKHLTNDPQNVILLVEHPPVYTIGIRTTSYSPEEEERLKKLGADFHRTNRGGLITFHGPGQLVAYPILNLKTFDLGVRRYVCTIEKAVIQTCRHFGVDNVRTSDEPNETGVWVGNAKVCAIGVHASRFITSHGLALNCNTDLSWYDHIVPCGLVGKEVASISKLLNREVSVQKVAPVLVGAFCDELNCSASNFTSEEQQEILKEIS